MDKKIKVNKRVAISQSNYIPWKGYFDLINSVDVFVLYDSAQYTKNDWRNRNYLMSKQGKQWLSIPAFIISIFLTSMGTQFAKQDYLWRIACDVEDTSALTKNSLVACLNAEIYFQRFALMYCHAHALLC